MTDIGRPLETRIRLGFPVDPRLALAHLRHGSGDPTIRSEGPTTWRATRTPLGAATIRLRAESDTFHVLAWGPGREWAVDALPRLLGERDDPDAFRPVHPLLRALHRRFAGLRFGRTDAVVEALLPAVVEQKVTGFEARASYRALLRAFGETAPGPVAMIVPPDPARLAGMPYHAFHPLGLEARRALTVMRVAATAARLEEASRLAPAEALGRLREVRGVGPWTAAEAARTAFGDPDAVSLGDYHVPSLVCWALGRIPGDETRMLELLEPYRGQRARAVRLVELSGLRPPRRGPRLPPRSIARM